MKTKTIGELRQAASESNQGIVDEILKSEKFQSWLSGSTLDGIVKSGSSDLLDEGEKQSLYDAEAEFIFLLLRMIVPSSVCANQNELQSMILEVCEFPKAQELLAAFPSIFDWTWEDVLLTIATCSIYYILEIKKKRAMQGGKDRGAAFVATVAKTSVTNPDGTVSPLLSEEQAAFYLNRLINGNIFVDGVD